MAIWTPAEISTELWLDANASETITVDTGVSGWTDKSGNSRNFVQLTGSKQPSVIYNSLNGLNCLRFMRASLQELQSTVAMPADEKTWFAVYKLNSLPASSNFIIILCMRGASGSKTELASFNYSGYKPTQIINDSTATTTAVGIPNALTTNPIVLDWTYNNGPNNNVASYTISKDGSSLTVGNSGTTGIADAALSKIGNRLAQSYNADMDLYEIICVDGIIDDDLRSQIQGYLAWKWGLQANLPADHPYRDAAPVGAASAYFRMILDQEYDFLTATVRMILDQVYSLTEYRSTVFDQFYGLRLAQLLTQRFADTPTVRTMLHAWYGALPELRRSLWQLYGSPLELRAKLAQSLTDAPLLRSGLVEIYEISLGLITTLEQSSGTTRDIRLANTQTLGECLTLRARLEQSYRDALKLIAVSGQPYTVAFPLLALARQLYTVSGVALQTAVIQPSNLTENDFIKSQLQQIYMSSSAGSQSLHSFAATIGGRNITSFVSVNIEAGREQYCLTGDIQLRSQAEYVQCAVGDPVVITHNAEEYHFIVESLARSRTPGEAGYTVNIASPAILLDAPYALPLTQEFAPAMAATIAQGLVVDTGVTLVWQLLDWPIGKNTLCATDETPLDVLRRLVASVGGILQSMPDGSLIACYRYPVDIDKLAAGTIGHYYTDADNMFSVADSLDLRSGQNVYLISDGLMSEQTHELREVEVDGDTYARMVQAYIVPWTGDGVILETSGGEWVSIEPLGAVTETIIEQVEFVNGEASTSSPIYAMIDRSWRQTSLGAITYGEDGTLSSEIDGESLAEITYQTRYHQWLVRDNEIEDVQFILTAA